MATSWDYVGGIVEIPARKFEDMFYLFDSSYEKYKRDRASVMSSPCASEALHMDIYKNRCKVLLASIKAIGVEKGFIYYCYAHGIDPKEVNELFDFNYEID